MSSLGLKESDFIGRPGYRRWPAKVWRRGVGYVDSYKWSYRAEKAKRSRRAIGTSELGEMIAPASRLHAEQAHRDMLARPTEVLFSENGKEYVDPEQAAYIAARNGWRAHTGIVSPGGVIGGEWCPRCDRSPHWCECGG